MPKKHDKLEQRVVAQNRLNSKNIHSSESEENYKPKKLKVIKRKKKGLKRKREDDESPE